MPGDGTEAGIGGGDQRAVAAGVTGSHPSYPLGEVLHVVLRQSASHVPEQHPVPAGGKNRERLRIADVDIGQFGRWRDQPDARSLRVGKQIGGRGCRQPHAVEAESRDRLERFAIVIEAPWKKGQPFHFEHATRERRVRGRRCRHGCHRLGERRRLHCDCAGGCRFRAGRGPGWNHSLHVQVVE